MGSVVIKRHKLPWPTLAIVITDEIAKSDWKKNIGLLKRIYLYIAYLSMFGQGTSWTRRQFIAWLTYRD